MTLKLQLSPDLEAKLRQRAALLGRTPETLVAEAVEEKLTAACEIHDLASPSQRLGEFREWFESHPASKAGVLDDSRESIYDGRGE